MHEGPPSPGRYIREQRQRRGMSIEQLAIDTKIPRASIEALEEDRFNALPGQVFVRGFFRCCARTLGLDPEVVLGLFHEHVRALHAPAQKSSRRERPAAMHAVRGAAAPPRTPALATASEPRPPVEAPGASVSATAAAAAAGALERVAPAIMRALGSLPHSRTLMWIAVCLVIAVIAVTAFAMSGSHVALPHS